MEKISQLSGGGGGGTTRQGELLSDSTNREKPNQPGPEVIKPFLCSTQLSMKFFLLINVKMPTIVGILTFIIGKYSILDLPEPLKSRISWYFCKYEHLKFLAQLS